MDPTNPLHQAIIELERHVAEDGWDQPARLYALVPTQELLRAQPDLQLAGDGYTPVEQEPVADSDALEELLTGIVWPETVAGCAVAVERLVLPAEAEEAAVASGERAAEHPDAQEVRIVAAVDRSGAAYCALRLRSHDDPMNVLLGPDLVPGLLELLHHTLTEG